MLFISGSEPKSKDHGWYEKICAAFEYTSKENQEAVVLEAVGQDEYISDNKILQTNIPLSIHKDLSTPIKSINTQLDISPSQQVENSHNNETSEENTSRGIIMHQMLNVLSRNTNSKQSQFYSNEMNNVKQSDIKKWWSECQNTITVKSLSAYFNPSCYERFYNEVPLQFKDNGNMVYGIIDRIIIKDKNITILDYKTHPYINKENIKSISSKYIPQMKLYEKGVQLLWPEYTVNSILLFTATSSIVKI